MAKNNHKCIVCGKEYRYCPNCLEYDKLPRWMSLFCGDNCHDVFQVACDFENGLLTKETAKEKLNKLDITERKKYRNSLKNSIDKILGEANAEKVVERKEQKVVNVEMKKASNGVNNFNQVSRQFNNFKKK